MLNQIKTNISDHMIIKDHFPVIFDPEKSKGSYFYDQASGKKILDFFTHFASWPISYNHPALHTKKFEKSILKWARHKIANSDILTEALSDFVTIFRKVAMPQNMPYLFLIEGGALSVENALKAAFDYKYQFNDHYGDINDYEIVHLKNAFHGRSGYTMSLTNTDINKIKFFPKFDWKTCPGPELLFPLDIHQEKNQNRLDECISYISRYFSENHQKIAAFIMEPILGEGGDAYFSKQFHQEMRRLTTEYNIILIYDEIQTGFGLTGKFWAHHHYIKDADLLCFGKKSQVCGVLGNKKKFDQVTDNVFVKSGRINSTWGGNIVDIVRATTILEVINQENLVENANIKGDYLLKEIESIAEESSMIESVRGKGLMIAWDLPCTRLRNDLIKQMFENQVLVLPCGSKSIRLRPMLDVSQEDCNTFLERFRKSLKSIN